MCVSPRAPPPESTTPIFARRVAPGAGAALGVDAAVPIASSAREDVAITVAATKAAAMQRRGASSESCGMRGTRPLFALYDHPYADGRRTNPMRGGSSDE